MKVAAWISDEVDEPELETEEMYKRLMDLKIDILTSDKPLDVIAFREKYEQSL